jgi:hypothetical protein
LTVGAEMETRRRRRKAIKTKKGVMAAKSMMCE